MSDDCRILKSFDTTPPQSLRIQDLRLSTRGGTFAQIRGSPNAWIFTHPRKGYLNVQPLAFFQDNVLQEDRFDEGLVNGMEDCELAYRLYRKRIFGKTDRRWTVNHLNHYSFRLNPEALQSDEHNLAYLWRKYPSVGKTGIVRSPP